MDQDHTNAFFKDDAQEGARYGLLCLMTGISEEIWCASWLSGLEFLLWDAMHGEEPNENRRCTPRQKQLLKLLSEEAEGWWVWDDKHGPRFLDLDAWEEWRKQHRPG